eukprot:143467-Rhodomonas_salina.2
MTLSSFVEKEDTARASLRPGLVSDASLAVAGNATALWSRRSVLRRSNFTMSMEAKYCSS